MGPDLTLPTEKLNKGSRKRSAREFEPVTNQGSLVPLAAAARGSWYLPEHHQWVAARSPVAFWLGFSSKAHKICVCSGISKPLNTGNTEFWGVFRGVPPRIDS